MTIETLAEGKASPFLDVTLRPYRSLPPEGFMFLMFAIGGTGFLIGFAFFLMGAWPVAGFCGLEFLLVYIAFRLNYRAARLIEHLRLSDDGLTITRITPKGEVTITHLEPNWLTVTLDRVDDEIRQINLRSHGKTLNIGRFLTGEELEDLANRLTTALHAYRSSPLPG
ncbi:DUF2244 domain-containing protein [Aestuariispira ectoiniformans]|uniref:DUF2244 domain-containing protein n=1 Tax=Aestuariispira ectoiniformans TaxID=2775080 RepID=UPI00223BF12F|nr:DUF2244 domain-containing protein [Aestuariispira ectoiniformans]